MNYYCCDTVIIPSGLVINWGAGILVALRCLLKSLEYSAGVLSAGLC